MSKRFKIVPDYYDMNEKIYEKSSVNIKQGLTVLVGCNGSGKTTLLRQFKSECKSKKIPVIIYDNYINGGSSATSLAGFMGDFDKVARDVMSSEGEKINDNIANLSRTIGLFVRQNLNSESGCIFILLDAIDSGYSADNIIDVKRDLFSLIIKDCENNNIEPYIIVSANEFELARGEQCLDVNTLKYINFKDYEDYRNFIIESRWKKNKRYGWEEYKGGN